MTAGTKSSSCKSLPATFDKIRQTNNGRSVLLKKREGGWDTRIKRGLQDYDTRACHASSRRRYFCEPLTDLAGSDSMDLLRQSRQKPQPKANAILGNGLRRREIGIAFPPSMKLEWKGLTSPSSQKAYLQDNGEDTISIRSFDRCLGAVKYRGTDSLHELRRAIVSAKLVCNFAFAYANGIRIERKLEPNIRARTFGPHIFVINDQNPMLHDNLDDLLQKYSPDTAQDTNEPSTRFYEVSFRDALAAARDVTVRRVRVIAAAATTVIQRAVRRRLAVQRMRQAKQRVAVDKAPQQIDIISVLQEPTIAAGDPPSHPQDVDFSLRASQEGAVIHSVDSESKAEEEGAAVMHIQCLARARSSRRIVSARREKDMAAIKIQAKARGRVVRRYAKGAEPLHPLGNDKEHPSPKSCTILAASQGYEAAKNRLIRVFISNVLVEAIVMVAATATNPDKPMSLQESHAKIDTTTSTPHCLMQNLCLPQPTPLLHLRKASPRLEALPSHPFPLSVRSEVKEAEPPALVDVRPIVFQRDNAKANSLIDKNLHSEHFQGEQALTPAPSSNGKSQDKYGRSQQHLYETEAERERVVEDTRAHIVGSETEADSACKPDLEMNPVKHFFHLQPSSAPAPWHIPVTTAVVSSPTSNFLPSEASNTALAALEPSSAPDKSHILDARSSAPADVSWSIEMGVPMVVGDSIHQMCKKPIKASTTVLGKPLVRVVATLGLHVRSGQYLMCSFSRSHSNVVLVLAFDPNTDRVHRGALEMVDAPEDDDDALQDVCLALAQRLRINVHGDVELCQERVLHSGERRITVLGVACAKDRGSCKDWVCSIWLEGETTLRIHACDPLGVDQGRSYHGVVRLADWTPLAGEVKGGLKAFSQERAQEFCQLLASHIEVNKEAGSVSLGPFRYLRSCGVRAKVEGSTATKYVVCSFWRAFTGVQVRVFDPSCGKSNMVNFTRRDASTLGCESKSWWDDEKMTTEMCYDVARRITIDVAGKAKINAPGSGRHDTFSISLEDDSTTFSLPLAHRDSRDYLAQEIVAGGHSNNTPLQDSTSVALLSNTAVSNSIATLGAAFAPEPFLVCSFWRLGDRVYVRGFDPRRSSGFFGDFDVGLVPLQDPNCCRKLAAKLSLAPDSCTLELAVDRVTVGAKAADGCVMLFSFASPHLVEAVDLETSRRYRLCLDRDVPISDYKACQVLASRLAVVAGELIEIPSNYRRLPQDIEGEDLRVFDTGDGQLEFITSDDVSLVVSPEQWHWTGHGALVSTDPQKLSEAIASRIVRADDALILLPP